MSELLEPWTFYLVNHRNPVALTNRDGVLVGDLYVFYGLTTPPAEVGRRIVACVNALRGLPTESIEAMRPDGWGNVVAESVAELRAEAEAATAERVIEYEVEGHPWASEEGCAPRVAGLDDEEPVRRVVTHEEAASARAGEAGTR